MAVVNFIIAFVNQGAQAAARRRQVVDWGFRKAMHVFGCATPFDASDATRAFRTGQISRRVNQDVLLLAGADDHCVPLGQLWDQARLLTAARSITCRVFTITEHAQAHCQVGNLPLAIAVMTGRLELLHAA